MVSPKLDFYHVVHGTAASRMKPGCATCDCLPHLNLIELHSTKTISSLM